MIEPFGVRATVGDGPLDMQLSKGLKSWPIRDAGGTVVGKAHGLLLEGWLGEGLSVENGEIRVASTIATPLAFARDVVERLAGLLLFETLGGPLGRRLYTDCGSTVPIVYCAENRRIGGSADQLFDSAEYDRRLLTDRIGKLVRNQGGAGWITGTLTAHQGVERLLANHYLDLDSFTQHRFWPRPDLLEAAPPTLDEAARIVADAMAGYSKAVTARYRTGVALTAGLDSRLVLASTHGGDNPVFCYTMMAGGERFDREIPPKICQGLGLRHQSLELRRATPEAMAQWDRLVGHAMDSANRELHPTLAALDTDVAMTGLYGEPARGFLYGHDWQTVNDVPADHLGILARLKQPRDEAQEASVAAWLEPIAHLPRSTVLDLAYLELRMGNWAMGQGTAQKAICMTLMPFAQWQIQNAFLTLSLADRGSGQLLPRIGQLLWPEAMAFPINRFGDWRDRLGPLNRLMRLKGIKVVQRYARKRLAR